MYYTDLLQLLRSGKENAITTSRLAEMAETSEKTVRKALKQARLDGYVILHTNFYPRGNFLPSLANGKNECLDYCESVNKHINCLDIYLENAYRLLDLLNQKAAADSSYFLFEDSLIIDQDSHYFDI